MDANWTERFATLTAKKPEMVALIAMAGSPEDFGEEHALYAPLLSVWNDLSKSTRIPAKRKVLTEEEIEEGKVVARNDAIVAFIASNPSSVKVSPKWGAYIEKELVKGGLDCGEVDELLVPMKSSLLTKGVSELVALIAKAGEGKSTKVKTLKDGREVSDSDFYRRTSDEMTGKGLLHLKRGGCEEVEYLLGETLKSKGRFYLGDYKGEDWKSVETTKSSKGDGGSRQVKVKDMSVEQLFPISGKCGCSTSIKKFANLCRQELSTTGVYEWSPDHPLTTLPMKACNSPLKAGSDLCSRHSTMRTKGKPIQKWSETLLCGLTVAPA